MRLAFALLVSLTVNAADRVFTRADLEKYEACIAAVTKKGGAPEDTLKACREPAEAGISGAQYGYATGLVTRNQGNDRAEALQWLEKAAATGNPVAAFGLGGLLAAEQSQTSRERVTTLFRQAVCAGYAPAVGVAERQGITAKALECSKPAEEDFNGEWTMDLRWTKIEPNAEGGVQLKLSIAGDAVHVFVNDDGEWREVKPGTFKATQLKQTMTVSSLESGWDFDGEWIESWTIQLLRTGPREANVAYLRTVNNQHVPASMSFRTFTTLAEGKAVRP